VYVHSYKSAFSFNSKANKIVLTTVTYIIRLRQQIIQLAAISAIKYQNTNVVITHHITLHHY